MRNFPPEWATARLGDVCSITTGKRDVNEGSPDGAYHFFTCARDIYRIHSCPFQGESILVAGNGLFSVKYFDGKFDAYQRTYVLQKFVIDGKFLYRYIQLALDDITKDKRGSTISYIRLGDLEEHVVPIAPLPEQQRIVSTLERVLQRVEACQNCLATIPLILKRFRQAVLALACSGRLTEDWRRLAIAESPTASGRSESATIESLFDLPSSWRWVALESVCEDITVGHVGPMAHEYQKDGIPFLRSQNVREFRFDPIGLRHVSSRFHLKLAKSALHPGDVAVVRSGYAGAACVIPDSIPEANCSDLVIIRPSTTLDPHYACIFINSNAGRAHVDEVKVGIAQSHFNIGSAKKTPLPLPPLAEQREIVRRVHLLFELANKIESRTANATLCADKLIPSILAKAFRGELVPTEAELARREGREYEPASVLLERIKEERAETSERVKDSPSRKRKAIRKPKKGQAVTC